MRSPLPRGDRGHTRAALFKDEDQSSTSSGRFAAIQRTSTPLMREIPKTELSPDNGCVIDTKWNVAPLKYHACAASLGSEPTLVEAPPMPEIIVFDHAGFRGAYARTNLSFLYLGDFWNDRISSLIIVSGVWQFFRDDYYKGDMWELGPGYYECFFMDKGPDDVVSSFKATALTWSRQGS